MFISTLVKLAKGICRDINALKKPHKLLCKLVTFAYIDQLVKGAYTQSRLMCTLASQRNLHQRYTKDTLL